MSESQDLKSGAGENPQGPPKPSGPDRSFPAFLGRRIRDERSELTARWVAMLDGQPDVDANNVLSTEDLLDHIPDVLERIADFVADPQARPIDALVVQDLGRLAELRRRQGFGLQELLREYRLLSELVREEAEDAVAEYPGSPAPREVAVSVGRLMDAMNLISATTAHSFELWRERFNRERDDFLEIFGGILAHELGNCLGAAETAIEFLNSPVSIDEDRRARLYDVVRDSIREGRQTAKDIAALARPFSPDAAAEVSLWLVVKESVWLAERRGDGSGVSVSVVGDVPRVQVPGPPVRIALANLLANAVEHHHSDGDERWVRVSTERDEAAHSVEITVEDNGPGIPSSDRGRVFDYRYRGDIQKEGSGLGLAITREVVNQAGGSISLHEGSQGGARFVLRVPAFEESV